jgi:hypothetical protein
MKGISRHWHVGWVTCSDSRLFALKCCTRGVLLFYKWWFHKQDLLCFCISRLGFVMPLLVNLYRSRTTCWCFLISWESYTKWGAERYRKPTFRVCITRCSSIWSIHSRFFHVLIFFRRGAYVTFVDGDLKIYLWK